MGLPLGFDDHEGRRIFGFIGHAHVRYLATRFSAKEAFSKAIGLGLRMPMTWRACEVVKARSGKPEIALHGELAQWFAQRRLRAHVSLTDESDYAAAFVVVETVDDASAGHAVQTAP